MHFWHRIKTWLGMVRIRTWKIERKRQEKLWMGKILQVKLKIIFAMAQSIPNELMFIQGILNAFMNIMESESTSLCMRRCGNLFCDLIANRSSKIRNILCSRRIYKRYTSSSYAISRWVKWSNFDSFLLTVKSISIHLSTIFFHVSLFRVTWRHFVTPQLQHNNAMKCSVKFIVITLLTCTWFLQLRMGF